MSKRQRSVWVAIDKNRRSLSAFERTASQAARRAKATARAKDLEPILRDLMSSGQSLRAIADTLNAKGIKTNQGSLWTAMAVSRVIKRLEENQQ